ncbi:MAG: hypothetical protein H7222_11530 [Methylotenera sp.]|nr:hypothetical protein [Oligoflexia bacterium]
MKLLLSGTLALVTLGSFSALAECPKLEGEYGCMISADRVDTLRVKRSENAGVTFYSLSYADGSGADSFKASAAGVRDDFGWMNSCTPDHRLVSVLRDGSATAAIYLNTKRAWVREYNGAVVQTCWRQK